MKKTKKEKEKEKVTKAYKKWLKENTYVTDCNPYEAPVRYIRTALHSYVDYTHGDDIYREEE
jgi:hypothetical protein